MSSDRISAPESPSPSRAFTDFIGSVYLNMRRKQGLEPQPKNFHIIVQEDGAIEAVEPQPRNTGGKGKRDNVSEDETPGAADPNAREDPNT